MRFYSLIFIIALLVSGCGYKASSKFARNIVGNSVSTQIEISLEDPENTVIIKDALDSSIKEVFHTSLTTKQKAKTHLFFSIKDIQYIPIQYDINGYIIGYKTEITLYVRMKNGNVEHLYKTKGSYDFSVVANAVLSDQERFDAIRFSATKAIRAFLAQVTAIGAIDTEKGKQHDNSNNY